jgi:hypothetical protein
MTHAIRSVLALVVAGLIAVPTSAEQAAPRLPVPSPAQNGDDVVVTLRDGREIRGEVGKWVDEVGFYVRPAGSAAWLIHPEDIVTLVDAVSGRALSVPVRHRGIGTSNKVFIAVAIVVAFVIWGRSAGLGGG